MLSSSYEPNIWDENLRILLHLVEKKKKKLDKLTKETVNNK